MPWHTPASETDQHKTTARYKARAHGDEFQVVDTNGAVLFTRTDPAEAIALAEGLTSGVVERPDVNTATTEAHTDE